MLMIIFLKYVFYFQNGNISGKYFVPKVFYDF